MGEKRETTRVSWTQIGSDIKGTMIRADRLIKGNEYIFRVRAENKMGYSKALESEPVVMRNPFTVPSQVPQPEITNICAKFVVVNWIRPESDGGSAIDGYVIQKREKTSSKWFTANKKECAETRFRVGNLQEGHEYEFRVMAQNKDGLSMPSKASKLVKVTDPIYPAGEPRQLKLVDTTRSSISLKWQAPTYDGDSPITGYDISILPSTAEEEDSDWQLVTSKHGVPQTNYIINGLDESVSYRVRVRTLNEAGASEPSILKEWIEPKDITIPPTIEVDAHV